MQEFPGEPVQVPFFTPAAAFESQRLAVAQAIKNLNDGDAERVAVEEAIKYKALLPPVSLATAVTPLITAEGLLRRPPCPRPLRCLPRCAPMPPGRRRPTSTQG